MLFAPGCASSKDAFKGTPVPVVTHEGLNAAGAETLRSLRKDPSIEAFVSQHGIPSYLIKKKIGFFWCTPKPTWCTPSKKLTGENVQASLR